MSEPHDRRANREEVFGLNIDLTQLRFAEIFQQNERGFEAGIAENAVLDAEDPRVAADNAARIEAENQARQQMERRDHEARIAARAAARAARAMVLFQPTGDAVLRRMAEVNLDVIDQNNNSRTPR